MYPETRKGNLGRFTTEDKILKGEVIHYEDSNLASLVLDRLRSNRDFVGQIEAATGKSRTYGIMLDRSIRCALWMKSQGVGPGDVIAVCSRNQLDVPLACFATLYLGAAVNPLDEEGTDDSPHLLNLVKPKMVFVSEEAVAALAEAAREVNSDLKIIVFGHVPEYLEFESVISSHPGVREAAVVGSPHPVDVEHPVAFVVKALNYNGVNDEVMEKELFHLVAGKLSDDKRLRGGVRFVDHLFRTPAGKIRRRKSSALMRSSETVQVN